MKQARMNSPFLPVMVMVVESGAIYSSTLLAVIVTYAAGNNAQFIILDSVRSGSFSLTRLVLNHIVFLYPAAHIVDRMSISIILEYRQFI
jgi:hypothetical protein